MKYLVQILFISLCCLSFAQSITRTEHAFASVLNGIELNNACVTPTHVQTIRGLKVCIEKKEIIDGSGHASVDYICTKWATETLSYPRTYTVQKCVQFKNTPDGYPYCGKYKQSTAVMPKTIQVRTWTENGDYNNYPGKTTKFTFPDCK